ncbi:MAG: GerMN domain-containing protein [Erysipelotrichaceae bacterium]|nr:GerMN domain-containing protein [Erysipelotrichaceae bacterium]
MKFKITMITMVIFLLAFVSYLYLQEDINNTEMDTYLQTVVFKDSDNELIPVSLNFYSAVDIEEDVMNRLEMMKSTEMESYGLYPVFSQDLEVLGVELNNSVLTINFNDELYSNNALDIIETLSFTMIDYSEVDTLEIQINGENVSYLPNSDIPLSALSSTLGLNNFEDTNSTYLHNTTPVMIYQNKNINGYNYYVPTTYRINENISLLEQVNTILHYIQNNIQALDASLNDGILTIELDSNILLDNETIDKDLEELIVLSLTSLENIDNIDIIIDGQSISTIETSETTYNYIKI